MRAKTQSRVCRAAAPQKKIKRQRAKGKKEKAVPSGMLAKKTRNDDFAVPSLITSASRARQI
jgi:hypothetical protein